MNKIHQNTIVFAITSTFLHKGFKTCQRDAQKNSDHKGNNNPKAIAHGHH